MGMPVSVEIVDATDTKIFKKVFDYFKSVDERFSPFKETSEVSRINNGNICKESLEMKEIFKLAEQTKRESNGYFDIFRKGKMDPSGIVKGWAIYRAAELISELGFQDFFIEAGGDIQTAGKKWKVGIRNPFKVSEIVKVLMVTDCGVATSGTYERGDHIYDPHTGLFPHEIASLTVIGRNILEADRFATAAFAMGRKGIEFIEKLKGFEGYMVDNEGIATMTSGFEKYV